MATWNDEPRRYNRAVGGQRAVGELAGSARGRLPLPHSGSEFEGVAGVAVASSRPRHGEETRAGGGVNTERDLPSPSSTALYPSRTSVPPVDTRTRALFVSLNHTPEPPNQEYIRTGDPRFWKPTEPWAGLLIDLVVLVVDLFPDHHHDQIGERWTVDLETSPAVPVL
jgi:hypothetical protein